MKSSWKSTLRADCIRSDDNSTSAEPTCGSRLQWQLIQFLPSGISKGQRPGNLYWYFPLHVSSILRFKHAKPTQPLLPSPMYGRGGIDSKRPTIFMTLTCTRLLGLNAPYNKNREGVSVARSKRIACVQIKADAKTSFYQAWMTSDKQCMDRPLILNSNWTRATRCSCIQNAQFDRTRTCISHILRFASGFSN